MHKTIEMPKESFTKWVTALRSGVIKQGQGKLCNKDGSMCCLGVLEYILEGKVEDGTTPSYDFLNRNNIKFLNKGEFISNVPYLTTRAHLTTENDSGTSFNKIADLLEQNVKFTDE